MRFALILFTLILTLVPSHATEYVFNTSSGTVSVGGTSVTQVEGVSFTQTLNANGEREYHFASSLVFESDDRVLIAGNRPARILVTGNIEVPDGMTIKAITGGGGGIGGSGTNTGGDGGGGGAGGAKALGGDFGTGGIFLTAPTNGQQGKWSGAGGHGIIGSGGSTNPGSAGFAHRG